jgi:amino acid transporter
VPTLGAWARGAVLTFFVVSVAIFAARHGVHGFGGHAFLPTYAVFIAVVPVLFFNYAGLEVPTAAGEEMTNPRTRSRPRSPCTAAMSPPTDPPRSPEPG